MGKEFAHCLGGDRLCTCWCGNGLRPYSSEIRDERGRQCQDCIDVEIEEATDGSECICWATDGSGFSVCGVPCPVCNPEGVRKRKEA